MFRFTEMRNVRMKPKLVVLFLMTGIFPLMVLAILGSKLSSDALMAKSFNQLDTVKELTSNRFAALLKERLKEAAVLAYTKDVKEACREFSQYYGETNTGPGAPFPAKTAAYRSIRDRYLPHFARYMKAYDYHDIYLIGSEHGNVLFSVSEPTLSGQSLSQGALKNSSLAQVWKKVVKQESAVLVDFEPYAPSNGMESAFIGYPVYDDASRMISVVVLQCTSRFINEIMNLRAGMGETGVSYIVRRYRGGITGRDRYELRSDIKLVGGGKYVVGSVFGEGLAYWKDAMKKGAGAGGHGLYTDNAGNEVLVSYSVLDFVGEDWALISKIDKAEVTAPLRKLIKSIIAGGGIIFLLIAAGSFRFARGLTQPIVTDVAFAQAISRGELDQSLRLKRKDELGDLGRALDSMAVNLREMGWLQRGKEGLDDQLRGELTTEEVGKRLISYMVKHLDGQVGALYTTRDQEHLELTASYAFTDRKGNFSRIRVGEGLVGQVALEREMIVFANAGEEAPLLNFGLGERNVEHLLTAPLVFQDRLLGVFQVGAAAPFSPLQRRFIEKNSENISILFNAARSRQVIHDLLDRAKQQQEDLQTANVELEEQAQALMESESELQAQQEELRVTNNELAEQAKALRESESELQVQQEELRITNEELEEQTSALKAQKTALGEKNNELLRAQDNIKQKAKDLEIASRYKSEFLANMSHELRTPLNSILILSQLFSGNREGNLTEKQVESAKAIHSSGSDLLKLINDVLDLSKVEAGMLELTLEEVTMASMSGELTRLFNGVAEDKGVEFVIDLAPDAPDTIFTDSHRLQQILRNLITNAFKFTEQGSVTLTVSRPGPDMELAGADLTAGEAVALSVTDTGIGIPQERQEDIFKAFKQVDGSTSRKYGGTGLGLSISRELANLLGGEVLLASEEGKGCTFTLCLPVRHADVETKQADARQPEETAPGPDDAPLHESPESPEPPSPKKVTDDRRDIKPGDKLLLIVEDDPKFAGVLKNLATQRGFKCLVAEDGETGLHFADYYGPCAILLDIGLPGIDGWEVMERLKGNPELRHIPVHFISASDDSMDALKMGAMEYLTKPVSVEKIEETLTRIETHLETPMKRLLVVEDDELQRESIRELMGKGDVSITTVGTGKEAFQEIVTGRYDCMILDLGLGDVSGFDLLKMIRDDLHCPRIPIIIYTGRDLTRAEDEKLQKYAETIIIKGVRSPERLLEEASLFLHRVEGSLPEDKQKAPRIIQDKEAALSGKNILLVDDDMRNVFALSSVLEEKEMNIVVARNGLEAVESIDEHTEIDLVLMDIMMPEMDGYQAMTEIRKREWCEKLPIIALTAKAMKGDRNRCIDAGASDYLAKPVDTDKLLSMLRVWLYR
ncbi:MAG: response regulator [Desulfobacteraceae bacterium]|nr:response regulator [Desulfobacteraceae bacterium]